MTKKKKQEPKLQTKANIKKWLARVLFLTLGEMKTWMVEAVYFNAKEKELVATDGSALFIAKIKPFGVLIPLNLENGLYDVVGDMLIKREDDENEERGFVNYRGVLPTKTKAVCSGYILEGIIKCMIGNKVYIDIWKYAPVLKILDKLALNWSFFNNSPLEPVLIEADCNEYNLKYIIMPVTVSYTHLTLPTKA